MRYVHGRFQAKGYFSCAECPATQANRVFLAAGILAVIIGESFLSRFLCTTKAEWSRFEGIKKIAVNYMQVVSLSAVFPMEWPLAETLLKRRLQ